ncbi:MAG: hypothetical protein WBN18_03570 [Flavobacteriaceae bacterium]
MGKWGLVCMAVVMMGCGTKVRKEDIPQLNGYWEIKEVVFPDGQTKEYGMSTTIDYIQVEGLKGFRKKVQPKFDGTFDTSNDAEFFALQEREGDWIMFYKTELSEWTERLVQLDEHHFSVVNEALIRYEYKRFSPININE